MMKFTVFPLLFGLFVPLGLQAAPAPRPNILYVYVDDMGWGSIGPNGQAARKTAGQPYVLTPNIDQLAAQGVNFSRAYGCTVCSPARSSQQSGFHQGHTFGDRNSTNNAKKAMRADDKLMGDVLSAAGYVTGYWGKWGYGASDDPSNPVIQNLQTLPTSHGYQHVLAELHHVRAHTFYQPTLWSAPAAPGATGGLELIPNSMAAYANNPAYPEAPAQQSDASYPATAYCDDSYAFAALDFVRAQGQHFRATGQPFFGLMAVQVPHSPYAEISQLPNWTQIYDADPGSQFSTLGDSAQQWAAMVTRIDAHLGNLLAALEDPNNDGDPSDSIVDDTLVIFQSDNGGPSNGGRTELDANGGLRGTKGSIYEGGLRVPLVVRWPGGIASGSILQTGTTSGLVVDVTDLLPTFCELAGVERPLGLDGVSLAPTLTGVGHQRTRDFLIHEAGADSSIIRGKYKLVNDGGLALYDLDADHDESKDISGSNAALVAELNALRLGERVGEPYGFATTYHQWTGGDNASASDGNNWSDYIYENAGVTYMSETGAPGATYPWIATMENTGAAPATALADADLDFLGLEIRGASAGATQTLEVDSWALTGRNEIRLAAHSRLRLDNGSVNSLRWVEIREDASFHGAGTVDSTIFNAGQLAVTEATAITIPGGVEVSVTGASNADGSGTSVSPAPASYSVTTQIQSDTAPTGVLGCRIDGLDVDGVGGANDTVDLSFDVTTDGQHIFAKMDNAGWLSSGGNTINGSGEFVMVTCSGIVVNLNGGAGNGSGTFLGFTGVDMGAWGTGEVAVINTNEAGSPAQYVISKAANDAGKITFEPSSSLQSIYDTTAGATGGWRPESFDFRFRVDSPGTGGPLPGHRKLEVSGSYHESDGAGLDVTLAGTATPGVDHAQLLVEGDATLAGRLAVTVDAAYSPLRGDTLTILSAASVTGTFANVGNRVVGSDGTPFDITYSATGVTLTVDQDTAQGTPFSWLESQGLVAPEGDHEAADLLDSDGDGMAAWEEYAAGTDPNDPNSRFTSDIDPPTPGDSFVLRWFSSPERVYHVESSNDLTSFDPLAGPIDATPPENSWPIPVADSQAFFRVRVDYPQN